MFASAWSRAGSEAIEGTPRATEPRAGRVGDRQLWNPTLSEKNSASLMKRCDKAAVTFSLSEPGRWLKLYDEESLRSAARYAAHKILSSQFDILRPDIYEQWKETGFSLRSRQTHLGEIKDDAPERGRPDLDIGLRSARPFVGTKIAGARITFEWDPLRDRTKLSASRKLGEVSTRVEVRHDTELETRVSLSIPVDW